MAFFSKKLIFWLEEIEYNVSDFPEELPVWRSSFLIGGSNYLKENVSLKIELLDNLNNPIYIEPVFMYSEGGGVRVSVEVYNNVKLDYTTGSLQADKINYDFETKYFKVSMFTDETIKMKVVKWLVQKNLES